jgi:hypothetical protein
MARLKLVLHCLAVLAIMFVNLDLAASGHWPEALVIVVASIVLSL